MSNKEIKMDWQELKNKISRKIVDFVREYGKGADTLIVGKKEHAILEAHKSSFDVMGDLWSMKIKLDETKESHLELVGKKVNFLKIADYPFTSYRVKVEVVMPSRLRVPFVYFLDSQNTSDIGVQIVGGKKELSRANKDLAYYQVSVEGINKDMVAAFVNYLYEIEKAYTIELACATCGTHRWVECRDTHYNNHLDGSKDICKGCKIHE